MIITILRPNWGESMVEYPPILIAHAMRAFEVMRVVGNRASGRPEDWILCDYPLEAPRQAEES